MCWGIFGININFNGIMKMKKINKKAYNMPLIGFVLFSANVLWNLFNEWYLLSAIWLLGSIAFAAAEQAFYERLHRLYR